MTTTYRGRATSGLFAGVLLLVPLAACSDAADPGDADASPDVTAADTSPTEETGDSTGARETGATGAGGGVSGSEVDCTGNSCSVTLSGDGAEGEVLGTQIVLGGVENGEATFRVGDNDFSCGQGESGSVGPLTFECTSVTEEAVTLTVTLG